jgi:iron complex transport system ATP-binding protein
VDVSFELHPGEMLAILGPNGSGKSTLLKSIIGILKPRSGKFLLDGVDLRYLSRRDCARMIGYVSQESSIHFPLTAMEYVLQGRFAQGRLIGFESNEDLAETHKAMELTKTTQFAGRLMNELSGGEKQRVMLARAIASGPGLLVLDEPVANLDIAQQLKMLELLEHLIFERGTSVIVVTHELNLASEFASRILMLKSGKILATGNPVDVITESLLYSLFGCELLVDTNPQTGAPRVSPTLRSTAESIQENCAGTTSFSVDSIIPPREVIS